MLELGLLAFANPWALTGLAALPAIWLLIRALPPSPQRTRFPAIRLLYNLLESDPPSTTTPWWLLLLRMLIAALLVMAFAHPLWHPGSGPGGTGPVLIVVENGWTAAQGWQQRSEATIDLLEEIARTERHIILVPTAPPSGGWRPGDESQTLSVIRADTALSQMRALTPQPWRSDPETVAIWLNKLNPSTDMPVFYVADALAQKGSKDLIQAMKALGPLTLLGESENATLAFQTVVLTGLDFDISLIRANIAPPQSVEVEALAHDGAVLGHSSIMFEAGSERAQGHMTLSPDVRADVARLILPAFNNAGAIFLLDDSSARPLIGIIETEGTEQSQPLQSAGFYLTRALNPYARLRQGDVQSLLQEKPAILILSDSARLNPADETMIGKWLETGGLFLRFAGPRFATQEAQNSTTDPLLPVRIRLGTRAIGGALSWSEPQKLGSFPENGPFAGLVPSPDVTITRQVLAQPALDLSEKTWARLEDETPLVTSEKRGLGRIVLFHTTAAPIWSNLALSVTFVDMLQRLLPLARPTSQIKRETSGSFSAQQHLSGFGTLIPPYEDIAPFTLTTSQYPLSNEKTPPGIYSNGSLTTALNLAGTAEPASARLHFTSLDGITKDIPRRHLNQGGERNLQTLFLLTAALLVFSDTFVSLISRGHLKLTPKRSALGRSALGATGLILALHLSVDPASAQQDKIAKGAGSIQLACVESGSRQTDQRCLEGLQKLSLELRRRTSVWPEDPVLVRPEENILGLYPLLYWPVIPNAQPLSDQATRNVSNYLRQSGLIIFDTGTSAHDNALPIDTKDMRIALLQLVGRLDLPALEPLGENHVLSHSFYILDRYPGRLNGRTVWVEQGSDGEDGRVSSLIIGGADWIGAWATGNGGTARSQLSLGVDRQQELAIRFGINSVIYALTGTYKADQVHLPALIERLGN